MSAGYAIIFVASLFGNSIIIHVIRTEHAMKTTTNYLILNQACSDILITLTESVNILHFSYGKSAWFGGTFGLITCKLFLAAQAIPPFISVWILVAVAVERFYAVTRLLQPSPISQHFKKTILLLWLSALALSSNALVNGGLEKIKQSYSCEMESFLTKWMSVNVINLTLVCVLPILIIAVLYTIVCVKLRSRDVPGEGTNQNQAQVEAMKTARKVTRMMITIVVLYVLCWFPVFIIATSQIFGFAKISVRLVLLSGWLSVCYCGLNPYVYFSFNQKFRTPFKKLFRNCLRKIYPLNHLNPRSHSVELSQM